MGGCHTDADKDTHTNRQSFNASKLFTYCHLFIIFCALIGFDWYTPPNTWESKAPRVGLFGETEVKTNFDDQVENLEIYRTKEFTI